MINKLRGLFKQSVFYGIGNFITKASGLVLMPMYALYISKAEMGLLALYETAYLFLLMISGWGAKGGFTRWYNEMKSEVDRKSLFFTTYFFNVATSVLGAAITAFVLYSLKIFDGVNSERIILIFALSSLFKLLFDVPFILLKLQQKAFKQTGYLTLNIILTVVFTVYFLHFNNIGFEGIFWAQLLSNGLTWLVVLPLIAKSCYVKWQRKLLSEMIKYGYPLAISNILTLVLTVSDRYILEAFYSLEAVGSFSVALKVANLLQVIVVTSFVTSYTFQYYKSMYDDEGSRYHLKIFTYFILFMVVSGLGIVYFGKEIVYVIVAGKKEYFDAIPVIPLLIIGLIFSGMRQVFVLPLTKFKKTKFISFVMILAGLLNIGLNFIVIPKFGKEGAALTTAISQLFAALWFLYKVNQVEKISYEWKKISIFLFSGVLYCFVFFMIPTISFVTDILIKLLLLVSYFVILYYLNVFDEIEVNSIRQGWEKWRHISKFKTNIKSLKNN